MKRIVLVCLLAFALLLTACQQQPTNTDADSTTTTTTTTGSTTTSTSTSTKQTEDASMTAGTTTTTADVTTATTTTTTAAATTTTTTTTTAAPLTPDHSVLNGKTFYIFGDSYAAGHTLGVNNTWSKLLANQYGMTYGNYGINGNGFVNCYKGDPMPQRYTVIPKGGDIILVVGGRNDYNKKTPLGSKYDTSKNTFGGAVNLLITNLQNAHPDTLILFATPWYVNDDLKAYSDLMLAICERRGIPCFNAADPSVSGVYMTDADWRAQYCMSASDTDHLNAEGMKLVLPKFEKFIGDEYFYYLNR